MLLLINLKKRVGIINGKVFQSNMSKKIDDGHCMTKMLIVMFSTNPVIGEKNKQMSIRVYLCLTGFKPVTVGFLYWVCYCSLCILKWRNEGLF